jgi:L-2-amino-thiazoline-4-carboxylic acid hydrolase
MDNEPYYSSRKGELLQEFDADIERWRPVLAVRYGENFASLVLDEARDAYEALIPQIPYIGGDDTWTNSLVESARCLAFYQAMKRRGKTAEETGQVLYDAILWLLDAPRVGEPSPKLFTREQQMERRKRRAEWTQQRQYVAGYVCQFVPGDGMTFDYGYDFTECAAQKFYHAQGASEFLSHYCCLDFAYSRLFGLGLSRTMTLADGREKCDHRFRQAE